MKDQGLIHSGIFQHLRQSIPSATNSQIEKSIRCLVENFDVDFYVNEYEDVACSEMGALEHYLIYGWNEQRKIRIRGIK
jgi:hypothetical protein